MTSRYAEQTDWAEHLTPTYTIPDSPENEAERLLDRASELIDFVTRGRAETAYTGGTADQKDKLIKATVFQCEYWLEVGEEHDVTGLRGTLIGGRVQVQHLPGKLGPRPARYLMDAGLLYSGVGAM